MVWTSRHPTRYTTVDHGERKPRTDAGASRVIRRRLRLDGAEAVTSRNRREADSATSAEKLTCPQCERAYLITRHCRRFCEQCGYVESCEDSFVPTQMNPREALADDG